MMRALFTSATGMAAQQLHLDVIANNLANVNTTGFKRSRADFQDLLYQTIRAAGTTAARGAQVPTGINVGLGVRPIATTSIFTTGALQKTDNPTDLAIEGDGFFKVLLPDGTVADPRDGAFKLDSQGRLVTSDGYPLEPEIIIPQDAQSVVVGKDGTVSVLRAGQSAPDEVGQIQLARFVNPAGLQRIGQNLFRPTAASGDAVEGAPGEQGFGTVAQNMLEMSNVQIVDEMVAMIIAQRAYEISAKAIQASDEMLSIANNLRR
jgi:flagellar basal-body rod protein FlgG